MGMERIQRKQMSQSLKYLISKHNREKETLKKLVKEYVQDRQHPLQKRWEIFVLSNMGNYESCIQDFEKMDSDYWCSLEINRNQVVDMIDEIEQYEEWEGNPKLTREDLDEVREAVLQKFIKEFRYDW
jgi:hypothetical protein